jgi:hypothetical protein
MPQYARVQKPIAFVGLPRAELDAALRAAGALDAVRPALDARTIPEPRHVGLGVNAAPDVLVLELLSCQVDGGGNEIPRATCVLAVGRDAGALAAGASTTQAMSVVHLLERYLNRYVPAKLYTNWRTTLSTGPAGSGDDTPEVGEWKVLFDGLTVGPTRRGSSEAAEFVLHLAHLTARLAFSSSISADVAPGTGVPAAFGAWVGPTFATGVAPATPFGAVAAQLAGGQALQAQA